MEELLQDVPNVKHYWCASNSWQKNSLSPFAIELRKWIPLQTWSVGLIKKHPKPNQTIKNKNGKTKKELSTYTALGVSGISVFNNSMSSFLQNKSWHTTCCLKKRIYIYMYVCMYVCDWISINYYDFRKTDKCGGITIHTVWVTFHLHIRKCFLTVGESWHWHKLPRWVCGSSILEGTQNLTGHKPQLALGDSALYRECGSVSWALSHPRPFLLLRFMDRKINFKIIY